MTVHWIDPHTLKRCKAAIACARMMGRHTYDVLACKIEQAIVLLEVCATITDNGSNFVKAFTVYSDSSDSAAVPLEDQDELLTFDSKETNTDDDLTQVQYELPPHYRCAAHTLNLIASKGADKFLSSSSTSKGVYWSSFAKSSALWNKTSRPTVASDTVVQEVVKRKLIVPTATRWNSHYDAVVQVADNTLAELNDLCTKLGLRCFSEHELKFLKEYIIVLKPLSRGLDIL